MQLEGYHFSGEQVHVQVLASCCFFYWLEVHISSSPRAEIVGNVMVTWRFGQKDKNELESSSVGAPSGGWSKTEPGTMVEGTASFRVELGNNSACQGQRAWHGRNGKPLSVLFNFPPLPAPTLLWATLCLPALCPSQCPWRQQRPALLFSPGCGINYTVWTSSLHNLDSFLPLIEFGEERLTLLKLCSEKGFCGFEDPWFAFDSFTLTDI